MAGALREVFARFGIDIDDEKLKNADKTVNGFSEKLEKLGAIIGGSVVVSNAVQNAVNLVINAPNADAREVVRLAKNEIEGAHAANNRAGDTANIAIGVRQIALLDTTRITVNHV